MLNEHLAFKYLPMLKKSVYTQYLKKTLFWVIGNAIFGLAPLIFMFSILIISGHKIGNSEVDALIHEGVVPFVCCAIMGGVVVEFILAGLSLTGVQVFVIYVFPLFILAIISIDYLLVKLNVVSSQCFNLSSLTTIFVAIFSLGYCLFAKPYLYIEEGLQHELRNV